MPAKWPILCRVGRKTTTQSINACIVVCVCRWHTSLVYITCRGPRCHCQQNCSVPTSSRPWRLYSNFLYSPAHKRSVVRSCSCCRCWQVIEWSAAVRYQNRLWWYGHVLRKEDTDRVKKCMEYEVEGSRPRGRPKRTWREVVQKDCQACSLNREDAVDLGRWKKLIKLGWWSWWWVGECFFWYQLIRVVQDKGP